MPSSAPLPLPSADQKNAETGCAELSEKMLSDTEALEKFANRELDTAKNFRKQLQKVSDAIHNALNKLGLDLGKSAAKDIKYAQETVDAWVDGMTTAISNAQKRKAQREQQKQETVAQQQVKEKKTAKKPLPTNPVADPKNIIKADTNYGDMLQKHGQELSAMKPVAAISTTAEFSKENQPMWDKQLVSEFKDSGLIVERKGIGKVAFNETSVENIAYHLDDKTKYNNALVALRSAKEVLKDGIEVGRSRARNVYGVESDMITYAAPVTFNGTRMNVAVSIADMSEYKDGTIYCHNITLENGAKYNLSAAFNRKVKKTQYEKDIEWYKKQKAKNEQRRQQEAAKNQQTETKVSYSLNDSTLSEYRKPITMQDVEVLRSIGRKSVNSFTSADLQKAGKWAYKFYQELGVKSPFFRAWFGDWRAQDKRTIKPVSISEISIEEALASMPEGTFSNNDAGWDIVVGALGKNDTVSHARNSKVSVRLLSEIKSIIENAVLLDTEISEKNSSKKHYETAFMHKLYAPVAYKGEQYLAKITVEEYGTLESKRRFYTLKGIKIDPVGGTPNANASYGTRSDTGSIKNISDLYSAVKQYDKDFTAARETSPVLLNKDGTPKKFYHGTDGRFTEFRAEEMSSREGSYFFAENREDAAAYGKNVMEVYLTGEKLADYDNQPHEFYNLKSKREQVAWLKERGYDGWYADMDSDGWGEVSVFSSTQVKSAADNIGLFDRNNPDIRFSLNDSFRTDQAIRKVLGKAVEQVHEEYADIDFSNIGEDTYSKFRKVIPELRKFVNGEVTDASAEKLMDTLANRRCAGGRKQAELRASGQEGC